ncbi:MAG: hypothetical protein ABW061_17885 [Polyangiaceae bacterium]
MITHQEFNLFDDPRYVTLESKVVEQICALFAKRQSVRNTFAALSSLVSDFDAESTRLGSSGPSALDIVHVRIPWQINGAGVLELAPEFAELKTLLSWTLN